MFPNHCEEASGSEGSGLLEWSTTTPEEAPVSARAVVLLCLPTPPPATSLTL